MEASESHIEMTSSQGVSETGAAEEGATSVSEDETSEDVTQVAQDATPDEPRPTQPTQPTLDEHRAALEHLRSQLEGLRPSRGRKALAVVVGILGVVGTIVGAVYGGWGGLAVAAGTVLLCNRILSTKKAQNKLIAETAPQMGLTEEQVKVLLKELEVKKYEERKAELEGDLTPLRKEFQGYLGNKRAENLQYYSTAKEALESAERYLKEGDLDNAQSAIDKLKSNLVSLKSELARPDLRQSGAGVVVAYGLVSLIQVVV